MKIATLTNRLQMVASLVSPCSKIADIGTDHAYLPIFLVHNGICDYALASDIKTGPAQKAIKNIEKYNLQDKIKVAVAAGLDAVDFSSTNAIIIAGMGGEMICEILKNAGSEIVEHSLILQPQTDLPLVRSFLFDSGYTITKELVCTEAHRVYNAMLVKRHQRETATDFRNVEIGDIFGLKDDINAYKNKLIKKLTTEKDGLIKGGFYASERALHIDLILKEIENYGT